MFSHLSKHFIILLFFKECVAEEILNAVADKFSAFLSADYTAAASCQGIVDSILNVLYSVQEGSVQIKNNKFEHKFIACAMDRHNVTLILHQQNDTEHLKHKVMNTENTLARLSSMISSESYSNLVDMINEMGLELLDVNLA